MAAGKSDNPSCPPLHAHHHPFLFLIHHQGIICGVAFDRSSLRRIAHTPLMRRLLSRGRRGDLRHWFPVDISLSSALLLWAAVPRCMVVSGVGRCYLSHEFFLRSIGMASDPRRMPQSPRLDFGETVQALLATAKDRLTLCSGFCFFENPYSAPALPERWGGAGENGLSEWLVGARPAPSRLSKNIGLNGLCFE